MHLVGDGGARTNNGLEQGEVQLALTTVINEMFSGRLLYPVYVAVLAPSHALGRQSSIRCRPRGPPLLLLQRSFASRGWFDAACHNADVNPPIVLESGRPPS